MRENQYDIAETCRRLHKDFDGPAPSYAMLWSLIASGRVPAERIGRRWVIRGADLPVIAAHYKLTRKRPADAAA
jgi:hypothetical protein